MSAEHVACARQLRVREVSCSPHAHSFRTTCRNQSAHVAFCVPRPMQPETSPPSLDGRVGSVQTQRGCAHFLVLEFGYQHHPPFVIRSSVGIRLPVRLHTPPRPTTRIDHIRCEPVFDDDLVLLTVDQFVWKISLREGALASMFLHVCNGFSSNR